MITAVLHRLLQISFYDTEKDTGSSRREVTAITFLLQYKNHCSVIKSKIYYLETEAWKIGH